MAAKSVAAAEFKALDRQFDELKALRLTREFEWQQIADVFLPRKDFQMQVRPRELRRRRLTSSVPATALRRGAGLLVAYMVDPTRPFIKPNVQRGLVAAGRAVELGDEARDYLGALEWSIHDRMMLSQSRFLTSISRLALELMAFGTGVLWTGRKAGFGPMYATRPLRACWIAENEDGEVDTLFYQFTMPLWRAVLRWPGHGIAKWATDAANDVQCKRLVTVTHAIYPRMGGSYGAVSEAKPFAEVYFCCEDKAVLEERGYDSFPYAVPRLDVEEGSAYGTGPGWTALPEALVLNALQSGVEAAIELKNNPPLLAPKRLFGQALDRRAGALNLYDAQGLGFQDARTAIQKIEIAGDVSVAGDYMRRLEQNIEQPFFTDWMRLRETGQMTAEEVRERRDLRIRAMSSFVPGVDRDLMGVTADRTLEVMGAENQLAAPPAQLSGVDVDWDYAGPLAIAQLKGQAEAVAQLLATAVQGQALDQAAVYAVNVEEGLRAVSEALGAPPDLLRSREAVATYRTQLADRQQANEQAEQTEQGARALRDGAQGVASLAAVDGGAREAA